MHRAQKPRKKTLARQEARELNGKLFYFFLGEQNFVIGFLQKTLSL